MITQQQALELIRGTLKKVPGLWSSSGEAIVFLTGLKESGYRVTRQYGGGPALSYWQIEPATHDDIWKNYLQYRPGLASAISAFGRTSDDLLNKPEYALLICRLKYLRDRQGLPLVSDYQGMAQTWKRVYNSNMGAGKLDDATMKLFKEGTDFVRNS